MKVRSSLSLIFVSTSRRTRTGSCRPALAKSTSIFGKVAEARIVCRDEGNLTRFIQVQVMQTWWVNRWVVRRIPSRTIDRPHRSTRTQCWTTSSPSRSWRALDDPAWRSGYRDFIQFENQKTNMSGFSWIAPNCSSMLSPPMSTIARTPVYLPSCKF